jgi:hypothetical protein
MYRAHAPCATHAPPPPQHVGAPLQVGELVLMRKAGTWFDVRGELRAIDDDDALVLVRDRLEVVELAWLRRA